MIISGTAGYLINCLRLQLQDKVRVAAPTGVAAFNVDGHTLHSLLSLPTKGEYKDLKWGAPTPNAATTSNDEVPHHR
jgi:ATP-dependent DNA helicase PIF1